MPGFKQPTVLGSHDLEMPDQELGVLSTFLVAICVLRFLHSALASRALLYFHLYLCLCTSSRPPTPAERGSAWRAAAVRHAPHTCACTHGGSRHWTRHTTAAGQAHALCQGHECLGVSLTACNEGQW